MKAIMKCKTVSHLSLVLLITLVTTGCLKSDSETLTEVVEKTEVLQPEGFPTKNIQFFLPVPAGGLIDVAMRSLADNIDFGHPVIVINRPGEGQTTGLSDFFSKADDPHILTTAGFAGLIIQPQLMDLPYSIDDFRYIALNHPPEPQILITSKDSKYQNWEDLRHAMKSGNILRYSAPNPEGIGRIVMLEIMSQEDINPEFVPYTGMGEGFSALRNGLIDFYIIDASAAIPHIKMNQFAGLMILGPDRLRKIPEVPCAPELKIQNMENFVGYTVIAVSNQTPDEIVKWLKFKIDKAHQSEAYREYLNTEVHTEEPLKSYTEDEITHMLHRSNTVIIENMNKFGMSGNSLK
jgi:tripartite-type tricarboxylate transporter receptor subunit TctC